jgi:hypothetical protein
MGSRTKVEESHSLSNVIAVKLTCYVSLCPLKLRLAFHYYQRCKVTTEVEKILAMMCILRDQEDGVYYLKHVRLVEKSRS